MNSSMIFFFYYIHTLLKVIKVISKYDNDNNKENLLSGEKKSMQILDKY
jgi:hypothetical protein